MLRKCLAVVLVALLPLSAAGETAELKTGHPQSYTVQRGDTLWDIAGRFLVKPWRWPEIWRANPQVQNPHLIYPGDTLTLTYVDGQPVVTLVAGEQHLGGRSYKRSPTAREIEHVQAIATIPLEIIGPFLSRPRVATEAQFDQSAYVLATADQHLIAGSGDRIYVRGGLDPAVTRYSLVRKGPAYRREGAAATEVLGYEAIEVGDAVVEKSGDPSTLLVTRSVREVLVGDRLFPQGEEQFPDFMPRAPEKPVEGSVISLLDAVSQVGQYQVVVLDVGSEAGVEPGHVLSVYQAGVEARDVVAAEFKARNPEPIEFERAQDNPIDGILENLFNDVRTTKRSADEFFGQQGLDVQSMTLPEEYTGEIMVFRTFDQVSYALVMDITRPVHLYDRVRNP